MTKKILSLFFIITAIGFMGCQRQGSTNGSFQPNGWMSGLPSQFDWQLDSITREGHAKLIIYENDKVTIHKKYTFNFTLAQVSSKTKGNEVMYETILRAEEDASISAHILITETSVSKDKGSSIEIWHRTASQVFLRAVDSISERAMDTLIGEHNGQFEELEDTLYKVSEGKTFGGFSGPFK